MFCPKCGEENPENAEFCAACGVNIGSLLEKAQDSKKNEPSGESTGSSNTIIDENRVFDKRNNITFIVVLVAFFILVANYILLKNNYIIILIVILIIILGSSLSRR
ncbi:MAG: zinc-ribbon domain-containing protein [Methanobacteriaceae archaeon]|nr:zinc-ribbon domain-containing protein [Methanobacteriaceae archaeon]